MKVPLLIVVTCALVWFLLAKPDRDAESLAIQQQLSFEADLRSQALESVMEKHRLASVLLVRTGIVEEILRSESPSAETIDRIGYLQALSGVQSFSVIKRGEPASYPAGSVPQAMINDGSWVRGKTQAFHGSLGRSFYINDADHPIYVFFVPYFENPGPPPAIIVVSIDLDLIRDSWQLSKNTVELVSDKNEIMMTNRIQPSPKAITVSRSHNQLEATLQISGPPPAILGTWLLRSLITGLLLLIAALLVARQLERRRLLTELAEQRAGEAERLELEVAQRTRELKDVQDQLLVTEKLALLGQMSASISHEINQPLAALKNYTVVADRQLQKGSDIDVHRTLLSMQKLTDRISRIVVNLRSFATNEPSPSLKVQSIEPVINEALSELFDRFPSASEHCSLLIDSDGSEICANVGRTRLLQVLINLLTNAWFACRDSDKPSIKIKLEKANANVTIMVTDNGPGFIPSASESVFDAFVSTRDNGAGLGLGLTISRSFIDSMGGSMVLKSSGNGASILINLLGPDRHVFIEE